MKDTNPDHYKVDGADFIKFMDDPQIKGFGDWMFANGYNTGELAVNRWISTDVRMPVESHSFFWKLSGTDKWHNSMWREQSDKVLVVVAFNDGTRHVTTGETHDGKWQTSISPTIEQTVTHWMPLPEPPKQET